MYLRDVVEEERFAGDIDQLRATYAHIDEVHDWLTWKLAENPRLGQSLEVAPDFRVLRTPSLEDTPAFWVMYSYDDNKIYLHSIQPVREAPDE